MSDEIRRALLELGRAYSEGRTRSVELPTGPRPMDELDQDMLALLGHLYEEETK